MSLLGNLLGHFGLGRLVGLLGLGCPGCLGCLGRWLQSTGRTGSAGSLFGLRLGLDDLLGLLVLELVFTIQLRLGDVLGIDVLVALLALPAILLGLYSRNSFAHPFQMPALWTFSVDLCLVLFWLPFPWASGLGLGLALALCCGCSFGLCGCLGFCQWHWWRRSHHDNGLLWIWKLRRGVSSLRNLRRGVSSLRQVSDERALALEALVRDFLPFLFLFIGVFLPRRPWVESGSQVCRPRDLTGIKVLGVTQVRQRLVHVTVGDVVTRKVFRLGRRCLAFGCTEFRTSPQWWSWWWRWFGPRRERCSRFFKTKSLNFVNIEAYPMNEYYIYIHYIILYVFVF